MDPQTHSKAVFVAVCTLGACLIVAFISLSGLAWVHDGIYADRLFQMAAVGGGGLLVLILGAPVVLAILQAVGFRVPDLPATVLDPSASGVPTPSGASPAPIPTSPSTSAPVDPTSGDTQDAGNSTQTQTPAQVIPPDLSGPA